jgi:hypothetical protein
VTTEQKIIKIKVGLLELAKQLGNVAERDSPAGVANPESVALGYSGHRNRSLHTTRPYQWLCWSSSGPAPVAA